MTRAAISTRVSTDDQAGRQTPIADQLAACRRFAAERDWQVVLTAADEGISGATWPRPGLAGLLEAAKRGEFDVLLVWDLSRFARDTFLFGHLAFEFRSAGVEIVSVSEAGASELEVGFKAMMAGHQRQRIREDVVRAMRSKASRQEYIGGRQLFGYRWADKTESKTKRTIVPQEAAVVARVFERADPAGESANLVDIAREVGWTLQRVNRALRHPGYAGAYTCFRNTLAGGRRAVPEKDRVVVWGAHEPIVPRECWDRVQERLAQQAAAVNTNHGSASLPLTGLLRCSECGELLRVRGMHRLKSLGGAARYYYQCTNPDCPGVGNIAVDGWPRAILSHLLKYLQRPDLALAIAEEISSALKIAHRTGALEAEIKRLTKAEVTLRTVMRSGEVTDTRQIAQDYEATSKALQRARAALTRDLRRAGVLMSAKSIQARLKRATQILEQLGDRPDIDRSARPVLAELVESITVESNGLGGEIQLKGDAIVGSGNGFLAGGRSTPRATRPRSAPPRSAGAGCSTAR